ncbi:MAG: TM0996/MTH895 family glutaredoxin-like protein [Planctomycetes bacterium]|nr:TM0996/MTH895 family glutaredoxin-like protein [Planctomycetota bacterium]
MKAIKVLGTGCPKCHKLSDNTVQAAQKLGLDYELEKVTDVMRFADFGVMLTPALVVDGKVVVQGRAPSVDELERLLA